MTFELDNTAGENSGYLRLRRLTKYACITFLLYITFSVIMNSANIFGSIVLFGVLWIIGIIIFRSRELVSGWLESELTFFRYVKEKSIEKEIMNANGLITKDDSLVNRDYSVADNDNLRPLSSSEIITFNSITKYMD